MFIRQTVLGGILVALVAMSMMFAVQSVDAYDGEPNAQVAPQPVSAQQYGVNTLPLLPTNPTKLMASAASTNTIFLVSTGVLTGGLNFWLYENPAYPCGTQGNHQFMVVQAGNTSHNLRHLLVHHHGGNIGFYYMDGSSRVYFPSANLIGQLSATNNYAEMVAAATNPGLQAKFNKASGWRTMIPSMCSHDFYYGIGQFDSVDGFARWGSLAENAAINYTQSRFQTDSIIMYGTSSGVGGAFYNGYKRANVKGIILDSDSGDLQEVVNLIQQGIQPYNPNDPTYCGGIICYLTMAPRIGFTLNQDEPYLKIQRGEVSTPLYVLWNQYDISWNGIPSYEFENLDNAITTYNPGGKSVWSMVCVPATQCTLHSPTLTTGTWNAVIYNWALGLVP